MPVTKPASRAIIQHHWDVLCEQIGHRTAGTAGEQQAADYIESRLRRYGLADVHQQRFEFPNWNSSRSAFKVSATGGKRPTRRISSARASVYSVSTPGKGVRGPMAYLQSGLELDFAKPLKGKIGLLIGALALGDEQVKRRVVRSGLKALINVDTRMPFAWPTSSQSAPHWVNGFKLPMMGIAYLDAIKLVEQMPLTVEVAINAKSFVDSSQNVMAQIVGRSKPDEVIIVSGHHDCVDENVGADDNGSGAIFMLELARILSRRRLRRTVRFISYGVEERLSIGSYLYMRLLSKAQQRQVVWVLNADGISSAVGTDQVRVTGTPAMERLAKRVWQSQKHPAEVMAMVSAYSDHFPFNIIGVPSVFLGRQSIVGGAAWQLHSRHDNPQHVSAAVLARTIDTAAQLLIKVANAPKLPFTRRIEPILAKQVATIARNVYRHPWSPDKFDYDR